MEYIKSNNIDPINTFFHFTRIANRESIEENGLMAVAGGENEVAYDKRVKTIYFSKGVAGVLKVVDVWARWHYNECAKFQEKKGVHIKRDYLKHVVHGKDDSYDKEIMGKVIFDRLYDDFKNRQYYTIDLIEGKDGDFEFGDIDYKKEMARTQDGTPVNSVVWQYGQYSDFGSKENPNNKQEDWNMNTKEGRRIIPKERLRIVETMNGRTDALSVILEMYDKYRDVFFKNDGEKIQILDDFIAYAKERYRQDKDYMEGSSDYGRRSINPDDKKRYQIINRIKNDEDINF